MRTRVGWLVGALGLLSALAGLAIMVILGPDSRFTTGPHAVDTDGIAVVTAPKVISWADVRIDVLAEVPVKKPIFVGLGNSVDVQNYVTRTARLEVTSFHTPWSPKTRKVPGRPGLPGAPTALDWWLTKSAGLGGASISTTLPDQTVSLAIFSVGASNLSGLKVSLAYGVKGGFAKGAGLLLLGSGGVWLSQLIRRDRNLWAEGEYDDEDEEEADEVDEADDDEVVYVYVDEDGVEHEISADEAQSYDVVDETIAEEPLAEEPEMVPTEPQPEPTSTEPRPEPLAQPEPTSTEPRPEPLAQPEPTSTEPRPEPLAQPEPTSTEPRPEPLAQPEPTSTEPQLEPLAKPELAPIERVVYVFVDEDGVEREISEHELADFEVVEDEEEP